LVLLTLWVFNTHFFKSTFYRGTVPEVEVQEHTFVAPKSHSTVKPINTAIDFGLSKRNGAPIITHIETSWASLDFSTEGASLETAAFKKVDHKSVQDVYTIFSTEDKAERFFLTAFSENTPFYYDFVAQRESEDAFFVTYQHSDSQCRIEKTFVVYKELNKIDLQLTIDPYKNKVVQPRIFFESPMMPDLQQDIISAVVIDGKNNYSRMSRASLKDGQGWFKPGVFGLDNKYYLHALVNDSDMFMQRAYYKFENKLFEQ
jgi:hypothetical protein